MTITSTKNAIDPNDHRVRLNIYVPISGDLNVKAHWQTMEEYQWKCHDKHPSKPMLLLIASKQIRQKCADGNGQKTFVLVFLCAPCLHTALVKREPEWNPPQRKSSRSTRVPLHVYPRDLGDLTWLIWRRNNKNSFISKESGCRDEPQCLRVDDYRAIIYISVRCTSWQEVDVLSTRLTREDMSPKSI